MSRSFFRAIQEETVNEGGKTGHQLIVIRLDESYLGIKVSEYLKFPTLKSFRRTVPGVDSKRLKIADKVLLHVGTLPRLGYS